MKKLFLLIAVITALFTAACGNCLLYTSDAADD